MRRHWAGWLLGATILGFLGCGTLGPTAGTGSAKPQQLSEEEQGRISRYSKLKDRLLVEELQTSQGNRQPLRFYNERMTYEGVLFLRYLGLRDALNEDESEQFIKALFERIPTDNPDGAPIRNIVIPRWYQKGFPLILQISTVLIQDKSRKFPAIVVLMNAPGDILNHFGHKVVRQLSPKYQYPRFANKDKTTTVEADGTYIFVVQGNLLVSSSTRMSGEIPSLESAKTPKAKLNLTDSYLRDENPQNDTIVFPVLKEMYEDEKSEPLDRLHAGLQLFLFYFFQQNHEKAEEMGEQLKASPILENSVVSRMEIKSIIRDDLPFILKMNRRLYR